MQTGSPACPIPDELAAGLSPTRKLATAFRARWRPRRHRLVPEPGGELKPSQDDIDFTAWPSEASEAAGLMLVDHVILGGTKEWCSMRREGHL